MARRPGARPLNRLVGRAYPRAGAERWPRLASTLAPPNGSGEASFSILTCLAPMNLKCISCWTSSSALGGSWGGWWGERTREPGRGRVRAGSRVRSTALASVHGKPLGRQAATKPRVLSCSSFVLGSRKKQVEGEQELLLLRSRSRRPSFIRWLDCWPIWHLCPDLNGDARFRKKLTGLHDGGVNLRDARMKKGDNPTLAESEIWPCSHAKTNFGGCSCLHEKDAAFRTAVPGHRLPESRLAVRATPLCCPAARETGQDDAGACGSATSSGFRGEAGSRRRTAACLA